MKNTLRVIAALLVMVVVVGTVTVLKDDPRQRRYHQHLSAAVKPECSHIEGTFCTHLPIVSIYTKGQKIPGSPILNEQGLEIGFETTPDGQEMINAQVAVYDSETSNNHLTDHAAVETKTMLRIRGNSSRMFHKKSYLMKFVDDEGKEVQYPVMGMAAHNEWTLYGPFLDKTLMRNYMWYNISGEMFDYAPNVRYCELFVDGDYRGLYLMTETISTGEGRVNLKNYGNGSTMTSWIARLDKYDKTDYKSLNTYSNYTIRTEYSSGISIVYPGRTKLTESQKSYIENDISSFEKALYSYDFNDLKKGYRSFIDVDSFVDFYILMEFLCQNDMASRSTYLTKDVRSKIIMSPVWDFNNVLDNYMGITYSPEGFYFTDRVWYEMLLKDEYFVKRVVERYKELRETVLNTEYLFRYMDETVGYLGESIERNFSIWGYMFNEENYTNYIALKPFERNPKSFEEAIEQMKAFIQARGEWMDNNIDALYQFCHDSKNKQFLYE